MIFNRVWAMPSADTFDIAPIHDFVYRYLDKGQISIDPFARNKRWATYTNDLNPDTAAEYHMDALDFLRMLKVDGIQGELGIFDPPYSTRQICEVYDGIGKKLTQRESQYFYGDLRAAFVDVLAPQSIALSFGWNSIGMGKKHGFEIVEILMVCHGGAHNDTICVAERRTQARLF